MRHLPRWLLFVAFVLILVLGALSSLSVVTMRESFPQTNGQVTIPALQGTATVMRDEYGVPHVYADTPEDLFAAEGFVHAQDRFFEMDFRRHLVSGRLSELFGSSQVETDTYIRTLGWRQVAEEEASQLSGSTRRWMEAYAAGVNAWLQSPSQSRSGGELSLEYAVLGLTPGADYQPEPWTVADTLGWFKAMAWDLDGNHVTEIERALLTDALGAERTDELYPAPDLESSPPVVTRGAIRGGRFDPNAPVGQADVTGPGAGSEQSPVDWSAAADALKSLAGLDDALSGVLGDPRDRTGGSNSWVVSPELSNTGSALLSNDPHLATSMPSTFTQIGLHCTVQSEKCPFDVVGFSFSGVPGVIIGHNAEIAWGMTTPYVDTQDLFIEQVNGNLVRRGDDWEPLAVRTEQLRVKGEDEPRTITIRSSRHGPLLSDVDANLARMAGREVSGNESGHAVALQWTALQPGTTAEALFRLNTASDFDSFRAAASLLSSPSQNLVYADRFGNIGYQLPGRIPDRAKGDGNLPRPGWDESWDWSGTIPFEELPWDHNPPSGQIIAANQTVIGPQYQHHLGSGASYGWRSDMISRRIAERAPLAPADGEDLFTDTTMGVAANLVPTLLRVPVDDPWVAEGQQVLVGWDYHADADSAAAAYFSILYEHVVRRTFGDELPDEVGYGGTDRWFAVLSRLIDQPDNKWWDDVTTEDRVETRDDILRDAMASARREITAKLSEDPSGWSWGKLHAVTLQHQTLGSIGLPPLDWMFNRGPLPVDGSTAVINAMGWRAGSGDYTVATAPAMRMLVDFADIDESRWINQSGVSGHASHPHYDDQFPLWVDGETIPMAATRTRVEESAVDSLELRPIA